MEYRTILENTKSNFMTYNGKMLFHFTKFESAVKILATNYLLFGDFVNMNDISEVRREIFSDYLEKEIQLYKSLSFTIDKKITRAFAIDPLWGYYAEKGNGICLAFNKKILFDKFNKLPGFKRRGKIHYIKDFSNAIFSESKSSILAQKEVEKNYRDIFFTKSLDWKTENEYRFLIKHNSKSPMFLNLGDSLLAVIVCQPLHSNIKETVEYKILKKQTVKPILRYTTCLGNKELRNVETNELLWSLFNLDQSIDI